MRWDGHIGAGGMRVMMNGCGWVDGLCWSVGLGVGGMGWVWCWDSVWRAVDVP